MDLPLKVEVPKFTHGLIVQVLLPFMPGTVVCGGIALGSPWIAEQMRGADIGYRTKLLLAFVLTYMVGFALITVTRTTNDFILGLIRGKGSNEMPWDSPYWRRVAGQYLNADLMPTRKASPDSDVNFDSIDTMFSKTPSLATNRERIKKLEQQLSAAQETIGSDKLSEQAKLVHELKAAHEDLEEKMRVLKASTEWRTLHHALLFIPTDTESPFESFSSVMGALQASGIAAMWVMLQYRELWNWSAVIFAFLLIIVATRSLEAVFRLNRHLRNTNAHQVAAMIREMK